MLIKDKQIWSGLDEEKCESKERESLEDWRTVH